jgi:photosystem II stability/assembly factor-like uncharacterized protein
MSLSVSFPQGNFIYDVHMFDSSNVLVLGYDALRRSTDGGYNWIDEMTTGGYNTSFSFINDSVGYSSTSLIYKTINSGLSWFRIPVPAVVWDIDFVNEQTGYAVISTHYIYKTTTGGNFWTDVLYGGNNSILCVSFINEENGMVSDGHGIRKTTDGGETWTPGSIYPQMYISDIWLFDENEGVAVGWGIFKTTDFGINWEAVVEQSVYSFRDVFFPDSLNGFVVGGLYDESSGIIMNTTDGGVTWEVQTDDLNYYLYGVHFYNVEIGMAVGQWGAIYKTIDGGQNWMLISNPTGVHPDNIEPSIFHLSQNYPNPFNPVTTIKYEIPGQARNDNLFVELKVYDILGNQVSTLVSEEQPAGAYEVEFDGTYLASGIYIYRLSSGNFSASKKLLLIK